MRLIEIISELSRLGYTLKFFFSSDFTLSCEISYSNSITPPISYFTWKSSSHLHYEDIEDDIIRDLENVLLRVLDNQSKEKYLADRNIEIVEVGN